VISDQSHSDANSVEATITDLLADARAGDAAAAAMTAMLIHLYPEAAQAAGMSSLYQWLLAQSLQSKEPELLACLAEELIKGKLLAADAKMARRAATKANEISSFMGAYVVGRLIAKSRPDLAIKQFRKGREAGHVASMVFEHELRSRSMPFAGVIVRCFFRIFEFFSAWPAYQSKDIRRLWRGSDVLASARAKANLQAFIGPDRQMPFARVDTLLSITASPRNARSAGALGAAIPNHSHLTSTETVKPTGNAYRLLRWLLRLVFGLFVTLCSLICLIGSCTLILDPQSANPLVAQTAGIVMALICIWLLSIGMRLFFNRHNHGGLLSPLVLRLVAIYMVAMPLFIIVTGRASTWNAVEYIQALFFLIGATCLWRLASWRKASTMRA
jgi:hypothetical protein